LPPTSRKQQKACILSVITSMRIEGHKMAWRRREPARFLLAVWLVLSATACGRPAIQPAPEALAGAPPELLERVRANPYNYFRFVNHEWTARVCEIFAGDLPDQPIVQLHGDAHLEQYAFTSTAWGLDDFDDSTRGPALVDIVRFLGSIDLAVRARGWVGDREALFDRFFAGYRRGLSNPLDRPAQPPIVGRLLAESSPRTYAAFLESVDARMSPMPETSAKVVVAAMAMFGRIVQEERPELADEYFHVSRAGWLAGGIGSALLKKVLIRVEGPSASSDDDVVLEAKAIRVLSGLRCLEAPESRPTFRVITGSHQIGRLKHDILAAGPETAIPEMAIQGVELRNWWVHSWESSYREITLDDVLSVDDLSAIVYDSGVQLGAGTMHKPAGPIDSSLRDRALALLTRFELRLRKEAGQLVEELMRGWNELRVHP
jgi:hypothetical protein